MLFWFSLSLHFILQKMPSSSTTTFHQNHHLPPPPSSSNHHLRPPPNHMNHHNRNIPKPPQHYHQYQQHDEVSTGRKNSSGLLRPHRRTNPLIWCTAALCVIFSLLLIVAGILTLIIFLVIKPRHPSFEIVGATLNSVYLDTPLFFNGDFTFLANFSNPNRKINLMFQYVGIELYFEDRLIAAQALEPFAQRRGEARLEAVHMVSSEVYFPPKLSSELQRQVRSNRVRYSIRGTFRVRASLGLGHYSYWLYGKCLLELTGPPTGVLVGRSCRTKR